MIGAIISLGYVGSAEADKAFLKALQDTLAKLGNPWIAGETEVSGPSWEEKQKLCGGIFPSPEELANNPVLKAHNMTGKLPKRKNPPPESWDWRDVDGHDWMTQPKSQGSCGSCWAFAEVGAFEARIKIVNNIPDDRYNPDLSEQFMTSCDDGNFGCDGGRASYASMFLIETGVPDEACYPYKTADENSGAPCDGSCPDWASRVEKAIDWNYHDYGTDDTKIEIMENGPVVGGIDLKEDFFYYKGGVYEPVMGKDLDHWIVLCGWKPGSWLIKNSWGTGEDQFSWISQTPQYPTWVVVEPTKCVKLNKYELNGLNNGAWAPGETIDIMTVLKGKGQSFTNVTGTLSTIDSYITNIVNETFDFGPIPEGNTSNNSGTPFIVTASSSAPTPHDVKFKLLVTADGGYSRDIDFTLNIGYKSEFKPPWGHLYGMAFDGTYLWTTDCDASSIIKLSAAMGNIVGEIPAPGGEDCTGIAWDGISLWVHNKRTKKIYEVDPSLDGMILQDFPSPATQYPTGLTFDGEYLWAVDRDAYKIYKVTTSGSKVSEFPIPISPKPIAGPRGLAFDPKGPDGGSLILFMTHFRQEGEDYVLDSTTIDEITQTGYLVHNHHKKTPESNGRAIEVHPYAGKYWVNTLAPPKVYRIDGFYEVGTEEVLLERRNLSLVTSPNPARDKTSVSFCVPDAGRVSLKVYDIAGKLVYCLVDNERFPPGSHTVTWNGNDISGKEVPYGIYFLRLKSNKSTCVKKVILLK